MTEPDPGEPEPAPPGTERLLAGLTREQAAAVIRPRPAAVVRRARGRQDPDPDPPRRVPIRSGRAAPSEILAVTFSVRAAGELRLRLADLLGEDVARGVTAATFHSVCARLLRAHAGRSGALSAIRSTTRWRCGAWSNGCSPTPTARNPAGDRRPRTAGTGEVLAEISHAKSELLAPDEYERSTPLRARRWWRRRGARARRSCGAPTRSGSTTCAVKAP